MSGADAAPAPPPAAPLARARDGVRNEARTLARDGLHLAALSSFALAQPLFDLVGRQAAFFAVRGSTATQIVAFALGVTLVPPLVLLALEALAGLASASLRRALHLAFVALLAGALALMACKRPAGGPPFALLAAAAVIGAAAALAYARVSAVRSLLTVLAPAPLVILALFLFFSPVAKLILPADAEAQTVRSAATAPVVFVVFDEFSGTSLLDAERDVDAVRYPNFAALARDATWFRRATSVSPWTERAVPAMLSGEYPGDRLPIARDYPRTLFTLLGRSHEILAHESLTRLCSSSLCRPLGARQITPGLAPLVSDAGIVYLHVLLPSGLTGRLPSVRSRWGDFGADEGGAAGAFDRSPERDFAVFLDSIRRGAGPRLYFLHVGLPHFPWQYLPSGRRYVGRIDEAAGLSDATWGGDPDLVRLGYQRYVLQVGFVDRLVGRLVARLRSTGLYDRALLVVTADHGVSIRPHHPWRASRPGNIQDLAFVPLFVKVPGQQSGSTSDAPVQTTDIVPTVADALGIRVSWPFDGRSALEPRGVEGRRTIRFDGRRYDPAVLERRRARDLAALIQQFGGREPWSRVLSAGAAAGLHGRAPRDFAVTQAPMRVEIDDESRFGDVDPSGPIVPAYVTGRLVGDEARAGRRLAIAVNGSIAATCRTYERDGDVRFAALVPESTFARERNRVEVFEISGRGTATTLASLGGTRGGLGWVLERDGTGEVVRSSGGRSARVRSGALDGGFHVVEVSPYTNDVHLAGWAADVSSSRIRDTILVFAEGRFVASASAPVHRPDLQPGIRRAGFDFRVPVEAFARGGGPVRVRVFAVAGAAASELGCAHRAVPSTVGGTLLLPSVCPSGGPAVASPAAGTLLTSADLRRQPAGSPGRALLVWWQSAQRAALRPYLRGFERPLRERLRRDSRTRSALAALSRALAGARPRIVDVTRSGRTATVFAELTFAPTGTTVPRAFELVRERGRWVLRDDFFVQSTIPPALRR